jgi:hypothetical protein
MARIEQYRFGSVVVDGKEETRDVIVLPSRVVRGWRREKGHRLAKEDLEQVLDELPERLIVGSGASGMLRAKPKLLALLEKRGVAVEVLPTAEAVQRYAELDPAHTAAALHLTC